MSSVRPKQIHDCSFSDAMHREIVERLEKSKALGLISDYFVSWIGVHGKLAPVVRAWRNPHMSAIRIREQVSSSLAGLVELTHLTIVDGDPIA